MKKYDKREVSVINIHIPIRPFDRAWSNLHQNIMSIEEMNEKIAKLDQINISCGGHRKRDK